MTSKVGAYGAVTVSALWIVFLLFLLVLNPMMGIKDPRDLENPARLLPALDDYPALIAFPALDAVVGLALLGVVLTLHRSARATGSTVVANIGLCLGVLAAGLFIVLSLSRLSVLPELSDAYVRGQHDAQGLFILANAVHNGLSNAIRFAWGLWFVLTGLLLRGVLPRWLCYLGIALGVLNVVSAYFMPAAAPNVLLIPLYFALLAVALFRVKS